MCSTQPHPDKTNWLMPCGYKKRGALILRKNFGSLGINVVFSNGVYLFIKAMFSVSGRVKFKIKNEPFWHKILESHGFNIDFLLLIYVIKSLV